MAAMRGKSLLRYLSTPNLSISPAQIFFYRGIASKLFVKGISFSTAEETLANAFSQFGQVVEVTIIMDKDRNRSKGYGYVTFATQEEAQKALMEMNGKLLDGRVIFVDNVRPRRHFNADVPIARGPPERVTDN